MYVIMRYSLTLTHIYQYWESALNCRLYVYVMTHVENIVFNGRLGSYTESTESPVSENSQEGAGELGPI